MYSVTCTLLKVVSYCDLSVLSMSVMGFQKSLYGGWVGRAPSLFTFMWKMIAVYLCLVRVER